MNLITILSLFILYIEQKESKIYKFLEYCEYLHVYMTIIKLILPYATVSTHVLSGLHILI